MRERFQRLTLHPRSRDAAVASIAARVRRVPEGMLAVTYLIEGDLQRIRIPAERSSRIADRLWQHTCCEMFIGREGASAYHEFNFAPSREWAAHAFAGYRNGGLLMDEALDPEVTVRTAAGKLELDALIRLDRLSPQHAVARLSIGLSAVIEDNDGGLSYWALHHPAGKPDFHHRDAFALELDEIRH